MVLSRATELTYADFLKFYTWVAKDKAWSRRKKTKVSDGVLRIYNIHSSAGEQFYLRLLLHNVKGAISFDYLRTVDSMLLPSFLEACKKIGLTADSTEWKKCLEDACLTASPRDIRNLFVIIIINDTPTDVLELFNLLKYFMSEDFLYDRRVQTGNNLLHMNPTDVYECLLALDSNIKELSNGQKDLTTYNLPTVPTDYIPRNGPLDNSLIRTELAYNINQQNDYWKSNLAKMNVDQKSF